MLAFVGVIDGQLERSLRQAERLGGDAGARAVERHHRVLEAAALFAAEQVLLGHAAVLEVQLDDGHAADAHLVLVLADAVALGPLFDDEPGDPAGAAAWRGDGEDRVERGDRAAGVPLLLAVDDVVVAVELGLGLHPAGVRAGVFLGQAERDQFLALGDVGKPAFALLFGPAEQDRKRAQGVDRVGHAHPAAGARELLDDEAQVEHAAALAAVLLGDPDARKVGVLDRVVDLPGELLLAVVLGRQRPHDLLRDFLGALDVLHVLGRQQLPEHRRSPGF